MNQFVKYQDELGRQFRAAYLIAHFVQDDLSEEEEAELERWMLEDERHLQVFENTTHPDTISEFMTWYYTQDVERNLKQVKQRISFSPPARRRDTWRLALAASIVGLIGFGIWFLWPRQSTETIAVSPAKAADIDPGFSKAVLVMEDGSRIALGQSADTLIRYGIGTRDGELSYTDVAGDVTEHRLEVPAKGFYKLLLPDGTRVWLNSLSSISYPSRFTGDERRVVVTGETYFEVAKDVLHPFIVEAGNTMIQALGTAFNVNAYADEPALQATLREGKIRVQNNQRQQDILPGQQLSINNGQWKLARVELRPILAWTENQFRFKNETIENLMRQITRWYGAQVVFRKKPTDHFTGTIDRSVPVSQVLKLMEATGQVHFEIEGDTIYVND